MRNLGKNFLFTFCGFLLMVFGLVLAVRANDPTHLTDFDDDGKTDFSVYDVPGCSSPFANAYFRYKSSLTSDSGSVHWGRSCDVPVAADYDGDGITDFAIFRGVDEYFDPVEQWWIYGSTDGLILRNFGGGTMVPRDYDDDGKADPARLHPQIDEGDPKDPKDDVCVLFFTYQLPNNESFNSQTTGACDPADPNSHTQIPAPGDYSGFGYSQIAVFDTAEQEFLIFIEPYDSSDATPFDVVELNIDYPVPGDFDGDGRTDYAGIDYYELESSIVYVWRVKFNTLIQHPSDLEVTWGVEGDKPVTGDFDGDGKTDIAVFRPSNHTYYVKKSSNGDTMTQNIGESDDLVVPAPIN